MEQGGNTQEATAATNEAARVAAEASAANVEVLRDLTLLFADQATAEIKASHVATDKLREDVKAWSQTYGNEVK